MGRRMILPHILSLTLLLEIKQIAIDFFTLYYQPIIVIIIYTC